MRSWLSWRFSPESTISVRSPSRPASPPWATIRPTVTVAGWAYAIQGDSVVWVDQQGSTHDDGWPSCLSRPGQTVPISFGEVPVTAPNGLGCHQVVWVDCNP